MNHYVSLDTNIYRQLGIDFWNKTDFQNLLNFLDRNAFGIIMTEVVYKELIDFYSNDVLKSIITDYTKVFLKMESTPLFGKFSVAEITTNEQRAKKEYLQELRNSCSKIIPSNISEASELIDFLLYNKRETKRDNTRDYILFKTLLYFAKKNPKIKVVLISSDKIFFENQFLQKIQKKQNIRNLIIIDSIASYINKYGIKIDFLTDELVIKSIKTDLIRKELLKDIKCLPSYIIDDYNNEDIVPELEELKIPEIKIYEYYPYLDEKERPKVVISLLVRTIAIFDSDKNKDYRDRLNVRCHEENHSRIDQYNRPIYDNFILFILEGQIDENSKKIIRIRFIDFIPDFNITKGYA